MRHGSCCSGNIETKPCSMHARIFGSENVTYVNGDNILSVQCVYIDKEIVYQESDCGRNEFLKIYFHTFLFIALLILILEQEGRKGEIPSAFADRQLGSKFTKLHLAHFS